MEKVGHALFEKLINPGPRLPWIKDWFLNEVWSCDRYKKNERMDFLHKGEEEINRFESLISSAASRIYEELFSITDTTKRLLNALSNPDTAVVVYDGLSIREIPIILTLAEKSGFKLTNVDTSLAAIPSESIDFIEKELPCGRVAPPQLQGRKELKEKGISAIYHSNYTLALTGEYERFPLLVWSTFPDLTYRDSGAKFENHFENIHVLFETAWINTVQQIKGKRKIIVTSDHGYIFFGTGMDFPRTPSEQKELNNYFGNDRYILLSESSHPPQSDDVFVDTLHNVAMVKGRVKTKSTGDAASRLYKHGGLSLMEMMTPWIELETGL
jgi:hypothetical protein